MVFLVFIDRVVWILIRADFYHSDLCVVSNKQIDLYINIKSSVYILFCYDKCSGTCIFRTTADEDAKEEPQNLIEKNIKLKIFFVIRPTLQKSFKQTYSKTKTKMSSVKCSFCGIKGHTIVSCNSAESVGIFEEIKRRAICYFTMDRLPLFFEKPSLQEKANIFNRILLDTYPVVHLKLVMTKIGCTVSGTNVQLAAKFIYQYFLLALTKKYSYMLSDNDRSHLDEYLLYWYELSGIKHKTSSYKGLYKFQMKVNMQHPMKLTASKTKFTCIDCMRKTSISKKVVIGCSHDLCKDCLITQLTGCQTAGKPPDCLFCCMKFTELMVHKESLSKKLNKQFCMAC